MAPWGILTAHANLVHSSRCSTGNGYFFREAEVLNNLKPENHGRDVNRSTFATTASARSCSAWDLETVTDGQPNTYRGSPTFSEIPKGSAFGAKSDRKTMATAVCSAPAPGQTWTILADR